MFNQIVSEFPLNLVTFRQKSSYFCIPKIDTSYFTIKVMQMNIHLLKESTYLETCFKDFGHVIYLCCDLEPKNIDRTQETASFLNVRATAWTVKTVKYLKTSIQH